MFWFPLIASAASSSLQFVPVNSVSNVNEALAVPLQSGNVLIAGSFTSMLNSSGMQIASGINLGSGTSQILAATSDANGNIWIAGVTNSDDFPLTNPLFTQKLPSHSTGFVAKLDSNLNMLFATFLGGQETQVQTAATDSTPTAIVVDSGGNAYVAGHTGEVNFPVTGPVLGTGTAGPDPNYMGLDVYGFISKIAPDGSKLIYSRLVGANQVSCAGAGQSLYACLEQSPATLPYALAVDASGSITMGGSTNTQNFPVTGSAYETTCGCAVAAATGFIARVSADGSTLVWATFLGGASSVPLLANTKVQSIALDASDNVYAAGFASGAFPASPNALQPPITAGTGSDGFAAKVSSDGTQILYGTNLGGKNGALLSGMTLDPSGNVWITGHTNSPDFPGATTVSPIGVDFALELNADASGLQNFINLVPGTATQPPAFDSTGNLLLLSSQGSLLRLNTSTALSAPAVFAVTNAAVLTAQPGVGPGEISTFFGVGLGPSTGIVAQPDANGLFPTELGGVTVQFTISGLPPVSAPLLYVGPGQINFQAPFRFLGQGVVTVTTPTGVLPAMQMPQINSIGVFQQNLAGYAAAVNEDGTVNSSSNPATEGSIVSLYVTGIGQNSPFQTNGAIWPDSTAASRAGSLGIEVMSGAFPGIFPESLPVLYAGPAPTLINGLFQINVELPQGVMNPALTVQQLLTGSAGTSNSVQIYAQ